MIIEISDNAESQLGGEVVYVLNTDHIKAFIRKSQWPENFELETLKKESKDFALPQNDSDESNSDDEIFRNPNHHVSSDSDSDFDSEYDSDSDIPPNPNHQVSSDSDDDDE